LYLLLFNLLYSHSCWVVIFFWRQRP
jgi:hypothetical protein